MSLTLVNLVEDHGFISEENYLHWYEAFWGSPKQSHESLCSKWTISYHCGDQSRRDLQNDRIYKTVETTTKFLFLQDFLSNEMVVYLHMLCSSMKHRIFC